MYATAENYRKNGHFTSPADYLFVVFLIRHVVKAYLILCVYAYMCVFQVSV